MNVIRIALFTLLWSASVFSPSILYAYSGGSGTQTDPFLISSRTDLEELSTKVNSGEKYTDSYFKMTQDITMSADSVTNPFTPIGSSEDYSFQGNFDGDSHVIKNLYVNISSSEDYVHGGLFGTTRNVTIQNLGIKDANINTTAYSSPSAGGLVGSGSGTFTNCYATGNVKSSATAASSYAGGLVGDVTDFSTFANCYATGNVKSSSSSPSAGGLVGDVKYVVKYGARGAITFSNCYATGNITSSSTAASSHAGGLVGGVYTAVTFTITNCYATGNVKSSSSRPASRYAGGLVGRGFVNLLAFTNCSWNVDIFKGNPVGREGTISGVSGKTTLYMQSGAFINDLNRNASKAIWKKGTGTTNCGYPIFTW